MDIYWNAIATPLFIIVLIMALVALFQMAPVQRASTSLVLTAAAMTSVGDPLPPK